MENIIEWNRKRTKKNGIFTLIDFVERGNVGYALLCLQFERAIRYAIYIEREDAFALEIVGSKRKDAQKLFEDVLRSELSPIHLHEVAFDQRQGEEVLNFFC